MNFLLRNRIIYILNRLSHFTDDTDGCLGNIFSQSQIIFYFWYKTRQEVEIGICWFWKQKNVYFIGRHKPGTTNLKYSAPTYSSNEKGKTLPLSSEITFSIAFKAKNIFRLWCKVTKPLHFLHIKLHFYPRWHSHISCCFHHTNYLSNNGFHYC